MVGRNITRSGRKPFSGSRPAPEAEAANFAGWLNPRDGQTTKLDTVQHQDLSHLHITKLSQVNVYLRDIRSERKNTKYVCRKTKDISLIYYDRVCDVAGFGVVGPGNFGKYPPSWQTPSVQTFKLPFASMPRSHEKLSSEIL